MRSKFRAGCDQRGRGELSDGDFGHEFAGPQRLRVSRAVVLALEIYLRQLDVTGRQERMRVKSKQTGRVGGVELADRFFKARLSQFDLTASAIDVAHSHQHPGSLERQSALHDDRVLFPA